MTISSNSLVSLGDNCKSKRSPAKIAGLSPFHKFITKTNPVTNRKHLLKSSLTNPVFLEGIETCGNEPGGKHCEIRVCLSNSCILSDKSESLGLKNNVSGNIPYKNEGINVQGALWGDACESSQCFPQSMVCLDWLDEVVEGDWLDKADIIDVDPFKIVRIFVELKLYQLTNWTLKRVFKY